jgi:hypothetical protein
MRFAAGSFMFVSIWIGAGAGAGVSSAAGVHIDSNCGSEHRRYVVGAVEVEGSVAGVAQAERASAAISERTVVMEGRIAPTASVSQVRSRFASFERQGVGGGIGPGIGCGSGDIGGATAGTNVA